jgi:hypothetical protein
MQETETVPTITEPDPLMVGDPALSPTKEEGGLTYIQTYSYMKAASLTSSSTYII